MATLRTLVGVSVLLVIVGLVIVIPLGVGWALVHLATP
jgi:hypothetical protein